jgi:hypothetical protein
MQGVPFRVGPVALSATLTTNIFNPPVISGGVGVANSPTVIIALIRKVRILNKTATAASFSLWLGATGANAAGTEYIGSGLTVPPFLAYDYVGYDELESSDFVVGGASLATTLTIIISGDLFIK